MNDRVPREISIASPNVQDKPRSILCPQVFQDRRNRFLKRLSEQDRAVFHCLFRHISTPACARCVSYVLNQATQNGLSIVDVRIVFNLCDFTAAVRWWANMLRKPQGYASTRAARHRVPGPSSCAGGFAGVSLAGGFAGVRLGFRFSAMFL